MNCVWFSNPSTGESPESLLSLSRLFTCTRWPLRRYKGGVGQKKKREGGERERGEREGRRGKVCCWWGSSSRSSSHVLFSRCFLLPPSVCSPASLIAVTLTGRNVLPVQCRGGEGREKRGTPLAVSPTFQSPPTRF